MVNNMSDSFEQLGINKVLLKAAENQGLEKPTETQNEIIPKVLDRKDIFLSAKTGTGKTAAYILPILQILGVGESRKFISSKHKQVKVIIIVPVRELVIQIVQFIESLQFHEPIKACAIMGGVDLDKQMLALKKGVDIVVATPGRLLDLAYKKAFLINTIETLVLDEADRMLEMGFIPEIKDLLKLMPRNKQTMLFSATYNDEAKELAQAFLKDPEVVELNPLNQIVSSVDHMLYGVPYNAKPKAFIKFLELNKFPQLLVFVRRKQIADELEAYCLEKGVSVQAIHGDKTQAKRLKTVDNFKKNQFKVLIATDIVARGLDIKQLPAVLNYELPNVPEDYVHRVGRTGRGEHKGIAYSFIAKDEISRLLEIEKVLGLTVRDQVIFDQSTATFNVKKEKIQYKKKYNIKEPKAPRTGQIPKSKGSETGFTALKKKR